MVRMRSSSRAKPAAVADLARDINFPHLWRLLRAAGWTARKPSGLVNDWSYASPDGADVLVGEAALVSHGLRLAC